MTRTIAALNTSAPIPANLKTRVPRCIIACSLVVQSLACPAWCSPGR
jgi:hypothetical protein